MWIPRARKRRIVISVLLLIVMGVVTHYINYRRNSCSEKESQMLIQKLCYQYKKGIIAGNICHDLCTTRSIKYYKCTNYKGGKTVLFTECKNRCIERKTVKAVLKATLSGIDMEFGESLIEKSEIGRISEDWLHLLKDDFKSKIYHWSRKVDPPNDVFSFLWTMNYNEYVNSQSDVFRAETAAIESISSLLAQEEYLIIKLNRHLPYIPKLYGSCGGFYLLEFAPPGDILGQDVIRYSTSPWVDRVKIAIQLLELSHSVDTDFNEPLHMCDVKGMNFGIDSQNVVKYIDLDTIFSNDVMMTFFERECSSPDDCDVFDCKGWCNITTKTCERRRTNNNLQSICENILVDRYSGLLYHPPSDIKTKLSELLDKCAYPNNRKGTIVRQKTKPDVYRNLYHLLTQQIVTNNQ